MNGIPPTLYSELREALLAAGRLETTLTSAYFSEEM